MSIPSSSSSVNGANGHNGVTQSDSFSPQPGFYDPTNFGSQSAHTNGFIFERHDADIVNHLYQSGFQTGNYADVVLHVHQGHLVTYRLHAIILSRSPFLAHLMSTSPPGNGTVFHLNLERDPEVTHEVIPFNLFFVLWFSRTSLALIDEKNCRAVLASAHLLGGMDELCSYSYDACRRSISIDSIGEWLQFLDNIPSPSDGSTTPDLAQTSIFGPYGQRLRDDVFNFLVVQLPRTLDIHSDSPLQSGVHGRDMLLQIFSRVPFDLFKTAVESQAFEIGSDQTRFKFAKDAIELRRRGIARGAEETVVLSNFGGSAIHITRKVRKRPLWKVNSSAFMATFNLFFTGKDDPLSCVIIGEDVMPRFFCFETPDRQSQIQGVKTTVSANNTNKVATLVFQPGNQLGSVTLGGTRTHPEFRTVAMADLLLPGSNHNARCFFAADGRKYEWRKCANLAGYDLYALNPPVVRVAAFRRCSEETAAGRARGLLQYTFAQDGLLLYTLVTLSLNRWIDMYAV
ncbi:BTB domain-containing protein [Favolaschia claudopus]|uniref:BTB domain-containing protein n=1 Tax=Favolaschia claudopus TaxID=2862362 RepID=A0AAW0AP12_9AGAR